MGKKLRKWANLEGKLDAPPTETDWQKAVSDYLEVFGQLPMPAIVEKLAELDGEADEAAKIAKNRNAKYEALEILARKRLEEAGSDVWRGGGFTVSPRNALHASVKDKPALVAWVKATDRADLLSVMPGTVTSLAGDALELENAIALTPDERAALKPGEPGSGAVPPGIEVFLRPTISRRKS